jgi:hypothetical protein
MRPTAQPLTPERLEDYAEALRVPAESIDPADPLPRFFEVAESEEKTRADLDRAADILLTAGFLRAVRLEDWEPE